MKTVQFNVNGMTCQGCARAVTNAVMALSGVANVDVDLEAKKVTVSFDDTKQDKMAIEEAITEAGYELF